MLAFLCRSGKKIQEWTQKKKLWSLTMVHLKKYWKTGDPGFGNDHFQVLYVKLGGGVTITLKCVKLSPHFVEVFCPIQLMCFWGDDGEIDPTSPVVFAISFSLKKMWKITGPQREKSRGLRFPRRNKEPKKLSKNDFRELDGLWERFLSIISL